MAITPVTAPLPAENLDPWIAARTLLDGQLKTTANAAAAGVDALEAAKGAASGLATLGPDSKLPASQLPAIALVEYLGPSANQAAMLAKVGQSGDWTVRTDLGTTWVITGTTPSQLASWTQLSYPTVPVTSVQGKTGAVTLVPLDIGAASATDLNNVDGKANDAQADATQALADAAAAQSKADDVEMTAAAALATANDAIPESDLISAVGERGVFQGFVLNALDVLPGTVQPLDVIVRRNA